eukprot:1083765-Amphidinium_carterae.1
MKGTSSSSRTMTGVAVPACVRAMRAGAVNEDELQARTNRDGGHDNEQHTAMTAAASSDTDR